jgi:hypothetical protein
MGLEFLFQTLSMLLASYVGRVQKLAQFAKWAVRIRDWLMLFFPTTIYPVGASGDVAFNKAMRDNNGDTSAHEVKVEDVKTASKTFGFNVPFVKGM